MPTLSPPSQTQFSAEHPGMGEAPGASLVAVVHKQLAVLEALAAEERAEAALLHTEIADLSTRLSATTARLARLEGTLASTEHVLAAIRTGLLVIPAKQPESVQPSAPLPAANRAEPRSAAPTPAPVASTTVPQPEQPRTVAAPASPEATPVTRVVPLDPPAPHPERVAPATTEAPREPERVVTNVPPVVTSAVPPQAASVSASAVSTPQPEPQPSEQVVPVELAAPGTGSRVQRGSTVEVVFDDDTTETYTIVRQSEANCSRNLIGENTPLGQALLGSRVGDVCRYRVANNPETAVRVGAIA